MDNIINTGDILIIDHGMYNHVGVADGCGYVYENSRDRGGRGKISLANFSDGKKIKNVGKLGDLSAQEIIVNAENLIKNNKNYLLLSNNCEHFIREICNVDIKSPQIQAKFISAGFFTLAYYSNDAIVRGAAIGAGVAAAFTKNEKDLSKNTAILSVIGAFFGWFSKKMIKEIN